jgi:cyclopropane-fatty-acyl-phospholipid synthase
LRYIGRRLKQFNSRNRSKVNVAQHYDLDGRPYSIFLDDSRQYSCAYFESPDQTLDDAQCAKLRHLAAKLLLSPGKRVLDVGSGWGGLGCYLAESCDAQVDGVTLSVEQFEYSCARARDSGYDDKIQFLLKDYRDLDRIYDRIVSVGMFDKSVVAFTKNSCINAMSCSLMRASSCYIRAAVLTGLGLPTHGSRSTFFQAAIFRLCPRCRQPLSAQGSW